MVQPTRLLATHRPLWRPPLRHTHAHQPAQHPITPHTCRRHRHLPPLSRLPAAVFTAPAGSTPPRAHAIDPCMTPPSRYKLTKPYGCNIPSQRDPQRHDESCTRFAFGTVSKHLPSRLHPNAEHTASTFRRNRAFLAQMHCHHGNNDGGHALSESTCGTRPPKPLPNLHGGRASPCGTTPASRYKNSSHSSTSPPDATAVSTTTAMLKRPRTWKIYSATRAPRRSAPRPQAAKTMSGRTARHRLAPPLLHPATACLSAAVRLLPNGGTEAEPMLFSPCDSPPRRAVWLLLCLHEAMLAFIPTARFARPVCSHCG